MADDMTADVSSDPHEQKLYQMFSSHDGAAAGSLDAAALRRLCHTLDMKDRDAAQLVEACLRNADARSGRVTFRGFKDGLLTLLGDEANGASGEQHLQQYAATAVAPTATTDTTTTTTSSPSREVSPKYVVAGKKYGRRSRPASGGAFEDMSSDSDDSGDDATGTPRHEQRNATAAAAAAKSSQKVQRSSSHSELHGEPRKRRPTSGTKLKRCASLPAQPKPFRRAGDNETNNGGVPNSSANTSTPTSKTKAAAAGAPMVRESSVESLGDWPTESSAVPANVIVDMWDTAGIPNPRSLLDTLGFRTDEIRISQLSLAIEDDLQSMTPDPESHTAQTLLRASLALHKAEVNALQLAFRQLAAQNRKLHSSNRDTNRRAALLAQEVDERHSHLESAARKEIQQLEQRHAETVRDLTAQMAADREQQTAYIGQLEQRNKTLEADDARLRLQAQLSTAENSALETELISVQRQCTDLLEENIRLNNTIVEVDERQRADDTRKGDRESEELLELMEKVSSLQLENANLRDKNDELVSEVEDKLVELTKLRGKKLTVVVVDGSGGADGATGTSATKRRGDSPSKTKLSEESPKLGKLRKCSNESDESGAAALAEQSDGSGDWMALNAELSQSAAAAKELAADVDEDQIEGADPEATIAQLKQRIADLQRRLTLAGGSTEQAQQIADLESSLEQMRKEFEDLEDYWQGKLNEERQLFEIDQHKSGEKFDELLKKLAEYEEQFVAGMEKASHSRLSPIEERDVLEQQYVELEDEMDELREHARIALDTKDAEIESLYEQLKSLQHRLEESAAAATAAAETATTSAAAMVAAASTDSAAGTSQTPPPVQACATSTNGEMPSLGGISCRSLEADSPASSPISYLWAQSTILAPARDYQNPNWGVKTTATTAGGSEVCASMLRTQEQSEAGVLSIQRPNTPSQHSVHSGGGAVGPVDDKRDSASDTSSVRSYGTPSVASTFNIQTPSLTGGGPHRDEVKQLKLVEMKLRHDIQELSAQRDHIVYELQQLQEFRPAMERSAAAYARSNHPSLMQRNYALEQRIRTLEQCLKNQHQYNESMMQQTCVQHNSVVSVLHARLEEQQVMINDQASRLVSNDLFAKDMFVENSQLGDLLEQQRMCNTRLRQHHQQI